MGALNKYARLFGLCFGLLVRRCFFTSGGEFGASELYALASAYYF